MSVEALVSTLFRNTISRDEHATLIRPPPGLMLMPGVNRVGMSLFHRPPDLPVFCCFCLSLNLFAAKYKSHNSCQNFEYDSECWPISLRASFTHPRPPGVWNSSVNEATILEYLLSPILMLELLWSSQTGSVSGRKKGAVFKYIPQNQELFSLPSIQFTPPVRARSDLHVLIEPFTSFTFTALSYSDL